MGGWSVNFLIRVLRLPVFGAAGLIVASLNMLVQIVFDFVFIRKDWSKLGGWIK